MFKCQPVRRVTAAILFRILDESAFGVLNAEERDKFMDELGASICSSVTATGEDASAFLSILNERLAEYAHYKKWIPEGEESAKGTLFWEFGKRVSPIVGLEKHAMFNLALTNLLLKSIDRWNLRELLLGSWNPARE